MTRVEEEYVGPTMESPLDLAGRIERLRTELTNVINSSGRLGAQLYWISLWLMLLVVISSIVAGAGGLSAYFPSQVTGLIALIPGAIALLAANLKFQEKSNWYYRRQNAAFALRSRLLLQLSNNPTWQDIASIAKDRDAMEASLLQEWHERHQLNFGDFEKAPDRRTGSRRRKRLVREREPRQ